MNPIVRLSVRALAAAALAVVFATAAAHAQGALPSPEQRRQAGAAFDSAVAARAQGDHGGAATFFETADRLAPSAQALGNAIREHREVHNPNHDARAATLALRLLNRYGTDARLASYANTVVQELTPTLGRVTIACTGCEVEVDQRLLSDTEFFVEPGVHNVIGHFSNNRTVTREFTARPGATETIRFTAPPETVTPATTQGTGSGEVTPGSQPPATGPATPPAAGTTTSSGGLLPVAVPVVLGIVTLGAAGVLVWSGMDTLSGVEAYNNNPTQEALMDGQARESRTNIMIGVTAGAGVLTLLSFVLTRVGGSSSHVDASPVVVGSTGLAPGLSLRGRF